MTVRHTIKHLAYQPLRTRNKHLQQKWDKASYELHRGKVRSAKPTINTSPQETYRHLVNKLKTKKLKEERTMKRENNMLEETISHILKTTGRVDNRNYYEQKSIGKEKRQLELLRITKENQMILLHLSQCKSHYNVRSWHDNWLKTLKVMDRIARYPQGRTNQKGQEKRTDCNKEQKISADESTNSPSSKKAKGKAESKEKRKETIERRLTLSQIHQMNPPDTAENPGSSDTIQIKTDTFPHTAKILSADGSEMPNIPATSSPAEE
ncbi:sperm axonemal maintenance protein CFAP97D1 [Pseudochaenichthys georgianus]|uniref:sperm axonemal maintenance protein CFAP97D1 n=1 Tax=Pseudochaenichthys georgianus TaxID=52239 RepID=UPI00146E0182|nr:uncharacterized protein si:dkey-83m22.7 isoform X1 [Pseudochaenichthys georgianus]